MNHPLPVVALRVAELPALQTLDALRLALAEASHDVVEAALQRLQRLAELGGFDVKSLPAAGAGDVWVSLEAGDGLLALLAAVRAGDVDALVV